MRPFTDPVVLRPMTGVTNQPDPVTSPRVFPSSAGKPGVKHLNSQFISATYRNWANTYIGGRHLSPAQTPFVRRANANGTTDSICTRCFVTVATATWEADLDHAERRHVCDSSLLERWKDMAAHEPSEGGHHKPLRPDRRKSGD